jgi:hypothetical protein
LAAVFGSAATSIELNRCCTLLVIAKRYVTRYKCSVIVEPGYSEYFIAVGSTTSANDSNVITLLDATLAVIIILTASVDLIAAVSLPAKLVISSSTTLDCPLIDARPVAVTTHFATFIASAATSSLNALIYASITLKLGLVNPSAVALIGSFHSFTIIIEVAWICQLI